MFVFFNCKLHCNIDSSQVREVQAPVQVKKNKKKPKTDVKPVQHVSTNDGKEPDDGKAQLWSGKFHNYFSFLNRLFGFTPFMFSACITHLILPQ